MWEEIDERSDKHPLESAGQGQGASAEATLRAQAVEPGDHLGALRAVSPIPTRRLRFPANSASAEFSAAFVRAACRAAAAHWAAAAVIERALNGYAAFLLRARRRAALRIFIMAMCAVRCSGVLPAHNARAALRATSDNMIGLARFRSP
jgi:hypothetical protein